MSHDGSVKLLFYSPDFRIYRLLCGEHVFNICARGRPVGQSRL